MSSEEPQPPPPCPAPAPDGDTNGEETGKATTTELVKLPQKRLYRQRAHCNPWSDHSLAYPVRPDDFDWASLYDGRPDPPVTMIDVGCGYGGLLFQLATTFPEARSLGMEIRLKVVDYVQVGPPVCFSFSRRDTTCRYD